MPLSEPRARREIHHRLIDMRAYAREDGRYDVEAHLVDLKPFDFVRVSAADPIPAGQALHDLWVRMTVDGDYVVREIEAASDVTPWALCKQAQDMLSVMVGERLARGWSAVVKERLRGSASCTTPDGNADPGRYHGVAGHPRSAPGTQRRGRRERGAVADRQLLCLRS